MLMEHDRFCRNKWETEADPRWAWYWACTLHHGPEQTSDKPKPLKGDIKFGVGLQAQQGDLMSSSLFVPWLGQHPSE